MATSSTPKKNKKVSFASTTTGFEFKDNKKKDTKVHDNDHKHWNRFGSLSKSEFSFISDRSSFAASLNTLSGNNSIADVDIYDGQDSEISPKATDAAPFTFGNNNNNNIPNSNPNFSNFISNEKRKMSMSSPSLHARHSRSAVSVTFSSTVSMFNDQDKRQNSMLFYDLWGIQATTTRMARSASAASQSQSEDQAGSLNEPTPLVQPMHRTASSLSSSIGFGSHASMMSKQTSMVTPFNPSDPIIPEDQEEDWSGFDIEQQEEDDDDDDDPPEPNHASKDSLSGVPAPVKKASSSLSGAFKYRKRKSHVTANFVFGKTQAQKSTK